MVAKLKSLMLVALLGGLSGCYHCYCAPKDLFYSIDRYCFVADWMNDHSCTSCHWSANNSPPTVVVSKVYDGDAKRVSEAASK